MAHFVKINENNIVEDIIYISNEDCGNLEFPDSELIGQQYIKEMGIEGNWKQTSYSSSFRNVFAGAGDTYDPEKDIFINPDPIGPLV